MSRSLGLHIDLGQHCVCPSPDKRYRVARSCKAVRVQASVLSRWPQLHVLGYSGDGMIAFLLHAGAEGADCQLPDTARERPRPGHLQHHHRDRAPVQPGQGRVSLPGEEEDCKGAAPGGARLHCGQGLLQVRVPSPPPSFSGQNSCANLGLLTPCGSSYGSACP